MTIYADTSFFLVLHLAGDGRHARALRAYEANQDERWLWSPWHRVEVFNSIRQLPRQVGLPEAAAKQMIHLIEADVRVGYYDHMEADWRDVLRTANEISIGHSFAVPCRAADLLHLAYARELAATHFTGFDEDQLALAQAVGFEVIRP
jgi:predicted nucleic acid-binding protein